MSFYSQKFAAYCIHVDVFRFKLHSNNTGKIAFRCIFLNILRNTVFVLKMMLSTMALDSLFLSSVISMPVAEKIRSDGMDVDGKARARLAIVVILEYFNSFFFHHSNGIAVL